MHVHSFRSMIGAIIERGRALRERARSRPAPPADSSADRFEALCRELLSRRGEASGVALAAEILSRYRSLDDDQRSHFFERLAHRFGPEPAALERAWSDYAADRSPGSLRTLIRAAEPPRQELFRRLNQAPGGTSDLVSMRADLLAAGDAALAAVDDDLVHLLHSWFNRGFLVIERISWSSPADLLERIIRYEAVHMIEGWDDLRRRVQPADRRCYAFFHPAIADEPLIFVEVALAREIPSSIQQILAEDRPRIAADEATTAVFYSISNCQPGLRGISFGSFLIKQVVEELKRDLPGLGTFVTLSPVPGFARWLREEASQREDFDASLLERLNTPGWHLETAGAAIVRAPVMQLAVDYFLGAKGRGGQPLDPVARFHLGNGARLERIQWLGDTSAKGLREGAGLMVNYLYDLRTIERNHEAYSNSGAIAASPEIVRQSRPPAAQSR